MVELNQNIKIGSLEKTIVNWPTPFLTIYKSIKSKITHDEYYNQTLYNRFIDIRADKNHKYHKLLTIKELHNGTIPDRSIKLNTHSACGYTRLIMAYLR